MKVLGITGGVGAGKSTILDYLEKKYHVRVIQLDQVGHMVQEPGQECYQRIVTVFGAQILNEDRTINRACLAAEVFGEPEKLQQLNQIVHPAVKDYIKREIAYETQRGHFPFLVIEAALLLEEHYDEICNEIWYVYVDEAVRTERLKRSRGYSEEKIQSIMKNQLTEAQYRSQCEFVIDNSSDIVENTYEQIDKGLIEHGFL